MRIDAICKKALKVSVILMACGLAFINGGTEASAAQSYESSLPAPVYVSPKNGAVNVNLNPRIVWEDVRTTNSAAVSYIFKMWKDSVLINYREGSFVPYDNDYGWRPSVTFGLDDLLDKGAAYTWQVTAKDSDGNMSEGPVYSFTTDAGGGLAPMPISPTSRSAARTIMPNFSWTPAILPGGDEPQSYTVSIDIHDETSLLVNDIEPDTVYVWRVTGAAQYSWNGKTYDHYESSPCYTFSSAAGSSISSNLSLSAPQSANTGEELPVNLNLKLKNASSNVCGVQAEITYDASLAEYVGITPNSEFSSLNIRALNIPGGTKSRLVFSGITDGAGVKAANDKDILLALVKFKVLAPEGSAVTVSLKNRVEECAVIFADKTKSLSELGDDLTVNVTASRRHIIVKKGETLTISENDIFDSLTVMSGGALLVKDGVTLRVTGEVIFETGSDITVLGSGAIRGDRYKVESIAVKPEVGNSKYVLAGETKQLVAEASPIYAANKDIIWSTVSQIVSVDANGLVTAGLPEERSESAWITAAALDGGNAVGTFEVTAVRPPISSISIVPRSIEVPKGGTKDLYELLTVEQPMALKPSRVNFIIVPDTPAVYISPLGILEMPNEDIDTTVTILYKTPYDDEKDITTHCRVYTPGSARGVTLKLTTKLEGRPSGGASGKPEANIEKMALEIYDVSNALLWSGAASADTSGVAEYVIENGVLNDGDAVQLWIKGERYLAVLESHVVAVTNGMWNVEMIAIARGGDADDSNRVAIGDFNILSPAFNWPIGQPKYNRLADFDNSGRVAIGDFNILSRHFNYPGDRRPKTSGTLNLIAANRNGTLGEALGLSDGGANASADSASGGCSAGWALLSLLGAVPSAVKKVSRKRLR